MPPLRFIYDRIRDAEFLEGLLAQADPSWWIAPPEEAAAMLIQRDGQPFMRVGCALRELLTHTAVAAEALEGYRQTFAITQSRIEELRPRVSIGHYLWRLLASTPDEPAQLRALKEEHDTTCLLERSLLGTGFAEPMLSRVLPIVQAFEALEAAELDVPQEAEDLYHALCRFRERQAIIHQAREDSGNAAGPVLSQADGSRLARGIETLRGSADAMRLLRRDLWQYRKAHLLFSWVRYADNQSPAARYPMLLEALSERGDGMVAQDVEAWVAGLFREESNRLSGEDRQSLRQLLGRVMEGVAEMGYPTFVRSLIAGQPHPSPLFGSIAINVIPGEGNASCQPFLLAIAHGNRRRSVLARTNVLRSVRHHLIRCPRTRAVVVLADSWDAVEFQEEHFGDFQAHYRNGVRFLFLAVGTPSTNLSRIPINLDQSL